MRLILAIVLTLMTLPAVAATCPAARLEPQVILTVSQSAVMQDNSKTIHDLIAMAQEHGHAFTSGGRHVPLGLTRVKTRYTSKLETEVLRLPDGTHCAYLKTLWLTVLFDNTTVYIATNLPRDSCIYDEVLAHEHKHVAADRALLERWKPELQRQAEDAARSAVVTSASTADEATKYIGSYLEPYLQRTVNALMAARDADQSLIDTTAEYTRISRSCRGEVRRYIPEGLLR